MAHNAYNMHTTYTTHSSLNSDRRIRSRPRNVTYIHLKPDVHKTLFYEKRVGAHNLYISHNMHKTQNTKNNDDSEKKDQIAQSV